MILISKKFYLKKYLDDDELLSADSFGASSKLTFGLVSHCSYV